MPQVSVWMLAESAAQMRRRVSRAVNGRYCRPRFGFLCDTMSLIVRWPCPRRCFRSEELRGCSITFSCLVNVARSCCTRGDPSGEKCGSGFGFRWRVIWIDHETFFVSTLGQSLLGRSRTGHCWRRRVRRCHGWIGHGPSDSQRGLSTDSTGPIQSRDSRGTVENGLSVLPQHRF